MLATLLATKLHRPGSTSRLVARPRLTQRLDEGLRSGHSLFLVAAPAGYGKTTLVTDWLTGTGLCSAWLSLDEADNDPPRFFAYVLAALEKSLGLQLAGPLPEAFPMMPQAPDAFVYPLINDLAAVDQPVLLALDDYHLITTAAIHEAIVFLLEHAPPHLHLVLLTRADPPFPLSRLRVRQRMTEIRDRDLRFTPEEMTLFLNSLHRLNLPDEQIAALESRTEGWAAGVQLAALSLQGLGAERAAEFISAFSGSHHYIVDYLFEEVLSRQPDAVREFLLQTSILERMCAPLCDAVLGWGAPEQGSGGDARERAVPPARHRSPAHHILETLERSNLFLVPLDDERCWYRYHHLFVDSMRGMLASASTPDQIAGLHGRAGDWYERNGFVADAVHHALQAGNPDRAAQIIGEKAWSMVLRAELATLRRWIQALPGEAVAARPWLRIYYAWASVFAESEAAEAQLKAVEQHLGAGGATALPAEMEGHIAAIRAWTAYMRGEPERAGEFARQALALYPQMDAAVRSGLTAVLGEGRAARNDLPGTAQAFAETVALARAGGSVMLEVLGLTSLGAVSQVMGRLHEAEAVFQEALQTATRSRSPVASQAYACLAPLYQEWNDLQSARRHAEKLIELSAMWGVVDGQACGHLFVATVLQAQGDIAGANQASAEAAQVMRQHPHEVRSTAWLGATQARLWLAQGKPEEARRWADARGLSEEGQVSARSQIEYLALARILLAEGRWARAARLLSRLQDAVESAGRYGNLPEVLVLRAVALDGQAGAGAALPVLEQAVRLARPEGYTRAFLDEGTPVQALLKAGVAQWKERDVVAYARKLLAAFGDEEVPPAAVQAPQPGILSERELEVLRLMAAGCSDREIADKLVIAVGTAKRHAANIFERLDVRNRTEAVTKARQMGLM